MVAELASQVAEWFDERDFGMEQSQDLGLPAYAKSSANHDCGGRRRAACIGHARAAVDDECLVTSACFDVSSRHRWARFLSERKYFHCARRSRGARWWGPCCDPYRRLDLSRPGARRIPGGYA